MGRTAISSCDLVTRGQSLLLLAVPDEALEAVAGQLSTRPQADVVLHTSGSRGWKILRRLKSTGHEVGAWHPLRPFPRVLEDPDQAASTFFAIDGTPGARDLCRRLVNTWGAQSTIVPGPLRPTYHFAASLAAGGTATLLNLALEIAGEVGIPKPAAGAFEQLARSAQEAVAQGGANSITGPVARGEPRILDRLNEARGARPESYPLLVLLALESLRQIEAAKKTPTTDLEARKVLRRRLLELAREPMFLDALVGPEEPATGNCDA